jgi:hypothetical protein
MMRECRGTTFARVERKRGLDDVVVVHMGGVILAAAGRPTGDRLVEVVERAGILVGAHQVDFPVWPPSRTWLQRVTFPSAAGAQSRFSSATVIEVAQVLFLFTMMLIASYATGSSTNSTLAAPHAVASLALMWREASAMSSSPEQKRFRPAPVLELPTLIS